MYRVSAEACEVLRDFYLKLRRENKTPEGTPITTRQLESLIRMAEARAKLELRETVTANHARVFPSHSSLLYPVSPLLAPSD